VDRLGVGAVDAIGVGEEPLPGAAGEDRRVVVVGDSTPPGLAAVVALISWNSERSWATPSITNCALKILCRQCSLLACANIISSTSVGSRPSAR
jgi:hypothetical protein